MASPRASEASGGGGDASHGGGAQRALSKRARAAASSKAALILTVPRLLEVASELGKLVRLCTEPVAQDPQLVCFLGKAPECVPQVLQQQAVGLRIPGCVLAHAPAGVIVRELRRRGVIAAKGRGNCMALRHHLQEAARNPKQRLSSCHSAADLPMSSLLLLIRT